MSDELRVRHATIADAPALRRLIGTLGTELDDLDVVDRFRALPEGHRVLVAEMGANVVGFAHVAVDASLVEGWRAQLVGFAVATEHRGIGVGKLLLEAADAWAREHGCSRLWVRSGADRDDAHDFYRANGFEDVSGERMLARQLGDGGRSASRPTRIVSTVPHD